MPDNTRSLAVLNRLIDLEHAATSTIVDRLNASPDKPMAYPIALAANSIVVQVIDAAIKRCLLVRSDPCVYIVRTTETKTRPSG